MSVVLVFGCFILYSGFKCHRYVRHYESYTVCIYRICASFTVTLDSPADSVCPRDTVVFICATDTGELVWDVVGNQFYFSTSQVPNVDPSFPIKFTLTTIQGANLVTKATISNVHLDDNGTVITCLDSSIPQLSNKAMIELAVSGIENRLY